MFLSGVHSAPLASSPRFSSLTSAAFAGSSWEHVFHFACLAPPFSKTGQKATLSYSPSQLDQGDSIGIYQDNLNYSEYLKTKDII